MMLKLPFIRYAGLTIAGPDGAPWVVPTATLDDWRECLARAHHRLCTGASRVEHGQTLEEALAAAAAVQLGSGSGTDADPVMGRPKPWPEGEEQRWIAAVYEVAARPSTHEACVGIETTDTPTADEWALEGPERPPLAYRRKRFAASGTVQTAWGRVPIAEVPRSARP